MKAYGNNRADNTFIPGGVIPGYVVIKPDFPECIDDFGFLWFEDEYVIGVAGSWVLAANAADAIVRQQEGRSGCGSCVFFPFRESVRCWAFLCSSARFPKSNTSPGIRA